MSEINKNKIWAFWGLGLAVLFWSINTVIAKGVVEQVPPMALSFFRWVSALVFVFPFAAKGVKKDWPLVRENLGFIFILSIFSVTAYNSFLYLGAQYTTATNISLVTAAMPAMTLGFAWMINQQRPGLFQTLGILISLVGVGVIISKGSLALFADLSFNPGDMLILASVAAWALYSVLLKKRSIPISPLSFLFMTIFLGTFCILPFYLWEFTLYRGFDLNPSLFWIFVYLGICPSILSYICWNFGVQVVGSATASIFMYLIPVFTAILAYFLLGERLFAFHMAGGGLIFCGLSLSSRQ